MEKLKVTNLNITSDEAIIQEMKQSLKNCPSVIKYCKDLGMDENTMYENITKIYDLVLDTNYCKKCPGLQKCQKDNAYLVTKITYNNKVVESQLIPCPELLKRMSFEKQLVVRDFPDDWLETSLSDVDKSKSKTEAIKAYTAYVKNASSNWIYLFGGIGAGKSFLAAAFAIDLAKRSIKGKSPVAFINAAKRFLELNDLNKTNNNEFKSKLDFYCNIPFLVIDDFGHELKTDFIRDAILSEIINTRCNKKLFTIFTSNFSLVDIEALYGTNNARAIMAKQIVKTIKSMCIKEIDLGDLKLY